MTTDTWLSPDQQRAWRGLVAMNTQLHAHLARALQSSSDLSYADFTVLVQLTDTADGRTRISELADRLTWERSRLSHHLKRMEARGLIEREDCIEDRRGAYVSVTPEGRTAIAKAAPAHVQEVRTLVFSGMSPAELAALIEVTERICGRLDQVPQ